MSLLANTRRLASVSVLALFACVAFACSDDDEAGSAPGKGPCIIDGQTFPASPKKFPCPDGCNTCTCLGDGLVESTAVACDASVDPIDASSDAASFDATDAPDDASGDASDAALDGDQ